MRQRNAYGRVATSMPGRFVRATGLVCLMLAVLFNPAAVLARLRRHRSSRRCWVRHREPQCPCA